jgi:aminoglycoside 6'-N-acetyltransferase
MSSDEVGLLSLRPVAEQDLAYFDRWSDPDADIFNFFGFRTGRGLRAEFLETGLISEAAGTVLTVLGDEVIGDVEWRKQPYGPPGAGYALNIGIRLLPAYRGRGHGTDAQRLLAEYLFATYPIQRVEASTDVENIAEQRALEKAGFTREGVLRAAQWRAGQWHDLVVYSRLRTDP